MEVLVMELDTLLTNTIEISDTKPMYDRMCKQFLSNKMILAWIMKECTTEYKDIEVEEIANKYIENNPEVASINILTGESIQGMGVDNRKIVYDIRYRATAPSEDGIIELIINVEAQNKYDPGYPLVKRGIYYSSCLIANQYGIDFNKADYNKIKKVYSIWICRNVTKQVENSITSYEITEKRHVGKVRENKANYDLMTTVMVCLGQATKTSPTKLLKMLNNLLSEEVRASDKLELLAKEYSIAPTETLEREVVTMCNLSEGIEEKGYKRGMEKGEIRGIKKGEIRGIKKGEIRGTVSTMRELEIDEKVIIQKLKDKFQLTDEEIQDYLNN